MNAKEAKKLRKMAKQAVLLGKADELGPEAAPITFDPQQEMFIRANAAKYSVSPSYVARELLDLAIITAKSNYSAANLGMMLFTPMQAPPPAVVEAAGEKPLGEVAPSLVAVSPEQAEELAEGTAEERLAKVREMAK